MVRELEMRGAAVSVHDPMFSNEELISAGFEPYNFGAAVQVAIIQANHKEYEQLSVEMLPGLRTLFDGRNTNLKGNLKGVKVLVLGSGESLD